MAPARKCILVVDDNAALTLMLKMVLQEKYDVQVEGSGPAALTTALRAPPDLILCDLFMPRMSGLELLAQLKLFEATAHVPVLLMTGDNLLEVEDLKRKGAAGIVYKPFRMPELMQAIADTMAESEYATADARDAA